ncbi:unnamed protein product [Orchesella dallaii]|uniref:RRM domain-containing protein n=1 Tax=Orchesella dallaii TaxID=48710 RepID=A0ABP1QMP9_9HEXA
MKRPVGVVGGSLEEDGVVHASSGAAASSAGETYSVGTPPPPPIIIKQEFNQQQCVNNSNISNNDNIIIEHSGVKRKREHFNGTNIINGIIIPNTLTLLAHNNNQNIHKMEEVTSVDAEQEIGVSNNNGSNGENNNEAKKVKLTTNGHENMETTNELAEYYDNGTNGDVNGEHTASAVPQNCTKPSKVVHIRNIPSDVSETEIVHLGIPFGRVSNVLVLKGKNQAFLELADESAAIAMVSYFTNCVAQLRGRSVYVQYSTHKELKTDQSHSNANSAAQAALQAAQALVGTNDTQGGPNTVLRVIIEQMVYPVTLDVLYQIFSRVGKVLRIVTFTKNGFFQALIQYPDVVMAQAAKLSLDGQNIYNGCCTLRIEYSKLASLNVRYNNDKSRDYTNPTLPTTATPSGPHNSGVNSSSTTPGGSTPLSLQTGGNHHSSAAAAAAAATLAGMGLSPLTGLSSLATNAATIAGLTSGLSNGSGGSGSGNPQAALASAAAAAAAAAGLHPGNQHHLAAALHQHHLPHLSNASLAAATAAAHNPHHPHHHHHPHHLSAVAAHAAAMNHHLHGFHHHGAVPGVGPVGLPGCVLLVSNLSEESITPDGLFTLFGVYGDVQRVKILFNKKDSALVQMREPTQAQLAMTYLDRLKLHGKVIRVTISKHGNVQMPKEGQPDAGLTKDYSNSPLHRFKKPDSKNYQNIYAPSATLHLSNIPASVNEDEISEAFKANGFNVKGFKFFPKDRKMALLQLPSVEEAGEALIKMHNHQLRENAHLRVSFSKSTI